MRGETVDSDALQVTVPVRPTAPTVTGETATVYQGKGKLTGTTADMEYKSATGEKTLSGQIVRLIWRLYLEVILFAQRLQLQSFASAPTDTIVVRRLHNDNRDNSEHRYKLRK